MPNPRLLAQVDEVDENGHSIAILSRRPDILAMKDLHSLLVANGIPLCDYVFLAGFAHLLYWSWPITMMATHALASPTRKSGWHRSQSRETAKLMDEIGRTLQLQLDSVKILGARSLTAANAGRTSQGDRQQHPAMNPSMKTTAWQDWPKLLEDVRTGRWQSFCLEFAAVLSEILSARLAPAIGYVEAMACLRKHKCHLYHGQVNGARSHYSSVHFLRSSLSPLGVTSNQTAADWRILSGMGAGAHNGCLRLGLKPHRQAKATAFAVGSLLDIL